ncbi:MAG: enoyl-CoA hydratase/isomerase family protein [Chloroflexi bacterium]|nr:enoyl-CoA hydratase/isomerase family protein [Chloroflexota bacterium]
MAYEQVTYSREGAIATLTLSRPRARNAVSRKMAGEIRSALTQAGADPEVKVLVVTGAGDVFCAGVDVNEASQGIDLTAGHEGQVLQNPAGGLDLVLRRLDKPTVAAVNGPAIGMGCDLALCCDFRVCAPAARFWEPYVQRGSIPSAGCYYLPRLVGLAHAYRMLLLGEPVGAEEAERIGLAHKVVTAEQLGPETRALAERLAQASPFCLQATKHAIWRGLEEDLESTLDYVTHARTVAELSGDFEEGIRAYLERREPVFPGRRIALTHRGKGIRPNP